MTNSDDKKRWKEESQQLKNDLKNRKKKIVKREVAIKFPKKYPISNDDSPAPPKQSNIDDFFKQNINFKA